MKKGVVPFSAFIRKDRKKMETKPVELHEIHQIAKEAGIYDCRYEYILQNKEGMIQAFINEGDIDEGHLLTIDAEKNFSDMIVLDWNFSFDEDFFASLEKGYEIQYMPLDSHYNVWCYIEDMHEDIEHMDGLQLYLAYCQRHSINAKTIQTLELLPIDVQHLYQEQNQGYSICMDMQCNKSSIVLGYRKGAVHRFVTWKTDPNRETGYYNGHYFSNFNAAYEDFKDRYQGLVKKELEGQKERWNQISKTKKNEVVR